MQTFLKEDDISAASSIIDIHTMKVKIGTANKDWGACARSFRHIARQAEDAAAMAEKLNQQALFKGSKP